MKHSNYNYAVSKQGYHLVFNNLSQACVVLDDKEYKDFRNLRFAKDTEEKFRNMHFIVDDIHDEVSEVYFNSYNATRNDRNSYYRIYTTLKCNAKCAYCFEKRENKTMTIETADKLLEFMEKRLESKTRLIIQWFGGEPLLNQKIISYITEKAIEMCHLKGCRYEAEMVTNGFLITEELSSKMANEWKVRYIQITLDGQKERYERIKNYGVEDAYERVLGNIRKLMEQKINVSIRINYDNSTVDETKSLIRELSERFSEYKNKHIYARRIMEDDADNSLTGSEDTDIEILEELYRCGQLRNILKSIPKRDNTCIAHLVNACMILPDGQIGKCSQAISKGDVVGNIETGICRKKETRWCSPLLPEKCNSCKLLPLCNGGCLFERFQNKNFCFASEKLLIRKLELALDEFIETASRGESQVIEDNS